MTSTLMNYTTRGNVENYLKRTFSEVTTAEFNQYLLSAEAYINNYLGYNAETTTSGIVCESIVREKSLAKLDQYDNIVVDLQKPPVQFDSNSNPLVTLMEFNQGAIRITLQLTDGSANALNTVLEVSENRRKVIYPSLYFLPVISTVTPTAKVNLYYLRDVKFWVDISYIGGFRTIPADITQAATIIAAEMVSARDNPSSAVSFQQGQYSVQYEQKSASSVKGAASSRSMAKAQELLQPYIRYTW